MARPPPDGWNRNAFPLDFMNEHQSRVFACVRREVDPRHCYGEALDERNEEVESPRRSAVGNGPDLCDGRSSIA